MEDDNRQFGSFVLRFFAYLYDLLLLWLIPLILIFMVVSFAKNTSDVWLGFLWIAWEIIFLQWLLILLYRIVTYLYFKASFGKMLAGLEIIKEDKDESTLSDALMRFPVGYSVSGILWGLGFFWILKDKKRKGFHDHIAQTVVVRRRSPTPLFFGFFLLIFLTTFLIYSIYTIGVNREIWTNLAANIHQILPNLGKLASETEKFKI